MTVIDLQVLFATGDVMAQQGIEQVGIRKHDLARTGRMTFYGGGTLSLPRPSRNIYPLRLVSPS